MTSRDPRIDPQPGDEVRDTGNIRHVIRREGDKVYIRGVRGYWMRGYWMRLDNWQKWCEESGAAGGAGGEAGRLRNRPVHVVNVPAYWRGSRMTPPAQYAY